MPMPLEKWQERLEGHFAALKQDRAQSEQPIFALEHGLNDEELAEIGGLLRARLKIGASLSPYWLVWVVYATEQGYGYDGDEYWSSFERATPNWVFSHRNHISPWFRKFRDKYNGVTPTGHWASHFRIIAWPITHAILPRYLQRQFARTLYELRFRIANMGRLDAASIGHLLAIHAHASSRFGEFLQQEELTGRIVLALLGKSVGEDTEESIFPATLQRIVADLEKARSARIWLSETKSVVTNRLKGLSRGGGYFHGRDGEHLDGTSERNPLSLKPGLLLRQTDGGRWSVVVEMPDFRALAHSSELLRFLKSTRCHINGARDMKPPGWLLAPSRKAVLKFWPDAARPMIVFEHENKPLSTILDTDCRVSEGPFWLFRLGRDGIGREIISKLVRPGRDYIIVTRNTMPVSHLSVQPCIFDCEGMQAYRVHAPSKMSAADISWFESLKLHVARTVRVWPSGFPGRLWDGEGFGEWLTTDEPCFGIAHDFPVSGYRLSLNGGHEIKIDAGKVGFPSFIQLPQLRPGLHQFRVKVQHDASSQNAPPSAAGEGVVFLKVREPEPWVPGKPSHNGLVAVLSPHDADLDDVWENELDVSIHGPSTHRVTCVARLFDGKGEMILEEQVSDPMELPLQSDVWHRQFAEFIKQPKVTWKYLEARSGSLTFNADELGAYSVRFERDALPVRWVFRREQEKIVGRLIDDTGSEEEQAACHFYGMGLPLGHQEVENTKVYSEFDVPAPGGLYLAKRGEYKDGVVVAATGRVTQLGDLGGRPTFPQLTSGEVNPAQALQVLSLWSEARLTGFMPDIRRRIVTDRLVEALFEYICGADWVQAEERYRANSSVDRHRDVLTRMVIRNNGFAAAIRIHHESQNFSSMPSVVSWFGGLAARFGVCDDKEFCDFALRMASQPEKLSLQYGSELFALMGRAKANPPVMRGARFLVVLRTVEENGGALLPRWSW